MTNPFRPTVIDPARLRVSSYQSSGMSPSQIRRTIRTILDSVSFAVSPEPVTSFSAGRHAGIADRTPGKGIVQGVTSVIGAVRHSDYNYKIEYGKPVCFDMVTGQAVTGVNPAWGPGEYKIIGTSLGTVTGGFQKLPVILGVQPTDSFSIVARPKQFNHPSILDWSAAESMEQQQAIWDFELPTKYIFNETVLDGRGEWSSSGVFAKVLNLTRMYIYKDTFVLLHSSGKPTLQFWCEFYMCQTMMGQLVSDLKYNHFAKILIDSDFNAGIEGTEVWVYDKLLPDAGRKLAKFSYVTANLMRRRAGGFCWQYVVTQSNKCPVGA